MAVHVAMLRGVNLGARRRVSMAELRTLLTESGYQDVRTYLQSGNIVIRSPAKPAAVERELPALIAERFGFDVPVIVRSRAQLGAVVKADPLGAVAGDEKRYVVTFLPAKPPAAAVDQLQRLAGDAEVLVTAGCQLYSWHPAGQARSKLAAALTGKALGANATARNWTTVKALLEIASQ